MTRYCYAFNQLKVCLYRGKYRGIQYREQSGGATGRGRMGTMARGDGRARAGAVRACILAISRLHTYLYIQGCTPVTSLTPLPPARSLGVP